MRYTHILFDVDNTLFDFDETERRALQGFFAEIGVEYNAETVAVYHKANSAWWQRLERGEADIPQLSLGRTADFLAAMGLSLDPKEYAPRIIYHLSRHSILFDGALELIERLYNAGCSLYFITNGIAEVQHGRVDGSPVRKYITQSFISGDIGHSKPSEKYFEYVMSAIGDFPKEKGLIVGDSLTSDIPGGAVTGLDTCWYNPAGKPCVGAQPTYTVSSYDELAQLILQ